jgi:hypothetical protein
MKITPVNICNMALSHLGQDANRLTTLSSGKYSAVFTEFYEAVREEFLRLYPNFNIKTTVPRSAEDDLHPDWAYSYVYPDNCACIKRIVSGENPEPRDAQPRFVEGMWDGQGDAKEVTAWASNGVMTVVGHGLVTGDQAYVTGLEGVTGINDKQYMVVALSANTLYLVDPATGYPITNVATYGTYTGDGELWHIASTRVILTDEEDPTIEYVALPDEDDANALPDYPSDYVQGLSHLLAARVAARITGHDSTKTIAAQEALAEKYGKAAAAHQRAESNPRKVRSSIVEARN